MDYQTIHEMTHMGGQLILGLCVPLIILFVVFYIRDKWEGKW
jgi:hypothetical protein